MPSNSLARWIRARSSQCHCAGGTMRGTRSTRQGWAALPLPCRTGDATRQPDAALRACRTITVARTTRQRMRSLTLIEAGRAVSPIGWQRDARIAAAAEMRSESEFAVGAEADEFQ